jgi:hypothetical protein
MDEMLQKARDMVAEAERLSRSTADATTLSPRQSGKRKADEITVEESEGALVEAEPTTKRAKVVEVELRKERVRRRALTGIAGVLALGYDFPCSSAAQPT